ncbi:MAG: pantoate--beta-alanine ligase [Actinomycetota bacterium]
MKIAGRIEDLRALLRAHRSASVGFVPTMGFLHGGHKSLIRRSASENDLTVVSVFVNPTQFGPAEDFLDYPRDLERDAAIAAEAGAAILFTPSVEEMYPGGEAEIAVLTGRLGDLGEGRFRPGHFDGVATVCAKLFNAVGADNAYFGEKDAQQLAVVRRLVRDFVFNLEIVGCPTVRESDGLAMSSRNTRLDPDDRRAAPALYEALSVAGVLAASGESSAEVLVASVQDSLAARPRVELQYAEVVDRDSFEPVAEVSGPALLTAAAYVGGVRLIDNVTLNPPE